jgi:3-methylcrotonyl-CoA carboxylase alpha subunit
VLLTYPATAAKPSRYHLEANHESADFEIIEYRDEYLAVQTGSHRINGRVYRQTNTFDLSAESEHVTLTLIDPLAYDLPTDQEETELTAPMPGRVVAVLVQEGQTVTKGTPLVVMEAMKMEHTIVAVVEGRVDQVLVKVADQVSEGAQLIHFTPQKPS